MTRTPARRARFRLHLAAIVVVSVICGWWMYRDAHAREFRTFGEFRRSPIGSLNGRIHAVGGPGMFARYHRRNINEFAAVLDAIPDETPIRRGEDHLPTPGRPTVIAARFGAHDYFNMVFNATGGRLLIQHWVALPHRLLYFETIDTYVFDYSPEVAAEVIAAVERVNALPQPK